MNNNEMETDFLNNNRPKQNTNKKNYEGALSVFLIFINIVAWCFYGMVAVFCGFIKILATCFLISGNRPKRKKRRF